MSEGAVAERLYREAIERLRRTKLRADLARAQLLYGEWLRREHRRVDAREQLRTAHDTQTIGMEAFAERARDELLATGENGAQADRRDARRADAQERQIARLARDGLSNPEIGARLFLSPRTVEWHLRKVFGKLEIRSRHELSSAFRAPSPSWPRPDRAAMADHDISAHRVVIVGGGFGGLQAARGLRGAPVEITLIDRRNFHLFQPLSYQVATGALSPGEVAYPLRAVFKRDRNVRVLLAEVERFDLERREVVLRPVGGLPAPEPVPYDTLIVAGGSHYSYFGHDEWSAHAAEVKSLESALTVRSRILSAFEAAELERDPERREEWLTFAVVGAGPTGVEMAGQIAELARDTLRATSAPPIPAAAASCSSRRPTACSPGFRRRCRRRPSARCAGSASRRCSTAPSSTSTRPASRSSRRTARRGASRREPSSGPPA